MNKKGKPDVAFFKKICSLVIGGIENCHIDSVSHKLSATVGSIPQLNVPVKPPHKG
jgi:hypothetical protein